LKKLLFISILFFSGFLFGNDTLDDFINQQIKVEKQLLDNNISIEEKIKIKKIQTHNYQEFFLAYAVDKQAFLSKTSPYKQERYRLKLRYNSNRHQNKQKAALRDELLLHQLTIRASIRDTLQEVLRHTNSESKSFFKDKIGELLVAHFAKYAPVKKENYQLEKMDEESPVFQELKKAYDDTIYLQYVANTFASELVENSSNIYRVASLSGSKIFTLVNSINQSAFGHTINTYLTPMGLDSAKVILIVMIILIIILSQKIIRFIIDHFLHHYKLRDDDINYIHSHITNIFNIITSLIIIHLILVVVLGFDSKSISISKVFAILYIILTALLLYRITNTIAYLKMERMQKSRVLKDEVINLIIKVNNGLILIVAVIAILKVLGVDLTALLSGLGIAGAAVAFAAKDSIANIFGSISILAGDIFEQGDWIQTKDADGTVVEIGLRATTIRTFDNALISVPNFELANKGVKNWTRRRIGRRIKMNIGVTYESDFDDIKKAIEEIRVMLKEHPSIANEHTSFANSDRQAKLVSIEDFKGIKRTTLVYMDEFADSSINILVYCFSRTVDWAEWLEVKEDVMFKIAEILKKNDLDFAYPAMVIHQADKEEKEKEE